MRFRQEEDGVGFYSTATYNLHHMETATGLHFVLLTSTAVPDAAGTLKLLYSDAYVPFVSRNAFQKQDSRISNPAFSKQADKIILEGITGS
jgi:hypothetical protein